MATSAKLYISCVIALGLALLVLSLSSGWDGHDPGRYAAYLAIAAIASTWKVKLPGMQGTMSVNFLLILLGVAELSLPETLVLGCLATVVQCFWKAKRRPRAIQMVFNVSAMNISAFACHRVANMLTDKPYQPAFLALAAAVFFVLNTASVSMVLALLEDKSFIELWRNCHLWTFPYYLTGAAIAAIISEASRSVGWRLSLAPLLMMYLVYTYYRIYLGQRNELSPVRGS